LANDVVHLGQEKLFLRRREGNRRIERCKADNGSVKIVEGFFVDNGRNLSGESSRARMFVENDYFVRLPHGCGDRLAIERRNRAQVDDFQIDSFFTQDFRGFERCVQHGSISNHA